MKALAITRVDEPTRLEVVDLPDPEATAGRVIAAVTAAGLGHRDALESPGVVPLTFPWVSGTELARRVTTVDDGATGVRAGDRVASLRIVGGGGPAEKVAADARHIALLPSDLALRDAGDLTDRRILVPSAAG